MTTKKVNEFIIHHRENTPDVQVIDDTIIKNIFFKGFPEYKIKPNHIIFDIGAHIGAFSLFVSSKLDYGKVYSFEPCLETFEILTKNIESNNKKNIFPQKVALSDFIGKTKLYYDIDEGNWGHSVTKEYSDAGEEVATDTLNNFFKINNIQKCDFMKFNCEGAEFQIIQNTSNKVLKKIDTMLVLYHLDLVSGYDIQTLNNKLKKSGFFTDIRFITDQKKRGWLIAMRLNLFQKLTYLLKKELKCLKSKLIKVKRFLK